MLAYINHVIPMFKILQWLTTAFRANSKLLSIRDRASQDLAPDSASYFFPPLFFPSSYGELLMDSITYTFTPWVLRDPVFSASGHLLRECYSLSISFTVLSVKTRVLAPLCLALTLGAPTDSLSHSSLCLTQLALLICLSLDLPLYPDNSGE